MCTLVLHPRSVVSKCYYYLLVLSPTFVIPELGYTQVGYTRVWLHLSLVTHEVDYTQVWLHPGLVTPGLVTHEFGYPGPELVDRLAVVVAGLVVGVAVVSCLAVDVPCSTAWSG